MNSFFTLQRKWIFIMFLTVSSNLVIGQSVNDYRSIASGNWNTLSTWQFYDGADWIAAAALPSNTSGLITIQNGHTVTISDNRTIDETTIEAGGTLTLSSGTLTINNGSGTDLVALGVFNFSNGTLNGTGLVQVEGTYNWQSGTFNGSATIDVEQDADLNISGTGFKNFGGSAVLNHYGTGT